MRWPRIARRVVWLVPWVALVGLSLAVPRSDPGQDIHGRSPSVEASARSEPPGRSQADSGTQVAAQAGDRLAQAFVAIDGAGGYTLSETVSQSFDGGSAPAARIHLVYDARGEDGPRVMAWGTAAVSDDPHTADVRIFARGATLHYDSGDGWDSVPYTGPADVYGAFGLYDEWDWLADAYRAGKVTLAGAEESETYVLTVDPDWLAARLADEGLALVPERAAYTVTVGSTANGPELDVRGDVTLSLGTDRIEARAVMTVRSILGLPPVEPPADLASGPST